jgi:diacylglycerol kinase
MEIFFQPITKLKIYRVMFWAIGSYILPLLLFLLFTLDKLTFQFTAIAPFLIFIVTLAPFSIIGTVLNTISSYKAIKEHDKRNKDIAGWAIYFGITGLIIGIIILMFMYYIVNM